jgi:signal transduction histidine kinase
MTPSPPPPPAPPPPEDLRERCTRLLREHVARQDEESLHGAYELGRDAIAGGAGILDMAAVLHEAASAALLEARDARDRARAVEALGTFLLECLSPFEMAHRGAREANTALRQVNEKREDEIKRIAHAIHDDAGQILATVHWAVDEAMRALPHSEREHFQKVRERLRSVEERLRQISYELRPTMLDDLGLEAALKFLAESVSRRSGVTVLVEGSTGGRLPSAVETALYRTVQEALNNVVRHAAAPHAVVRLDRSNGEIRCSIRDDGIGFPTGARAGEPARGLGLIGIRERVAHLGGTVEIRSEPGKGTEVFVPIPLETSYADAHRISR